MRHTNYLLEPVTIDNAKPYDKACALNDGGGLLLEVLSSEAEQERLKRKWATVEALVGSDERLASGPSTSAVRKPKWRRTVYRSRPAGATGDLQG